MGLRSPSGLGLRNRPRTSVVAGNLRSARPENHAMARTYGQNATGTRRNAVTPEHDSAARDAHDREGASWFERCAWLHGRIPVVR